MKAGFAKSDITPRLGVQLAGYGPYRNRAAREIVAPLQARALVLTEGRHRALVLSLELCGVPRDLALKIRTTAAARVGCGAEDVLLSVTHTHSAPSVGGHLGWGEPDRLYVETLPARVAEAAARAWAARTEVTWRHAQVPCEGIAVNRESDTGFAMDADFAARITPAWRPEHPEHTDATVRVLTAYQGGKLLGLLHHFGCHPVVYGEQTFAIHGDYAGMACLQLEQAFPGAVAMFFPGALGDINPKLNHRNPKESRRALHAISKQYTSAVRRGAAAAAAVSVPSFTMRHREVRFTRQAWSRRHVERRITTLEKLFTGSGVTDAPEAGGPAPLATNGMKLARLEGLRALLAQYRGTYAPNPPVLLQALQLGSVLLLSCGLEAYHRLQAPVLRGSPHPYTWLISLAGGMGYAPDQAALERAGYAGDFVPLICGELPFQRIYEELPRELVKLARAMV